MSSKLPELFLERLHDLTDSEDWPEVVASFDGPKDVGARVNTLVTSIEQALGNVAGEGLPFVQQSWFGDAIRVPCLARESLLASRAFQRREVYLQNPASMLPVLALDPRPGEEILDLCAAPGSKTLQIAAAMNNEGRIAANERARPRFFKLKANVEAYGARIVSYYGHDGRFVWRKVGERFDRVLLDAPCSSESRFRSDEPDTFRYWGVKKIRQLVSVQKQLLDSAFRCLKPGGVLVYSTCSFAPEENEALVDWMVRRLGGLVSVDSVAAKLPNRRPAILAWGGERYDPTIKEAVRITPDDFFDGFFLCRLRKHGSHADGERPQHSPKDDEYADHGEE